MVGAIKNVTFRRILLVLVQVIIGWKVTRCEACDKKLRMFSLRLFAQQDTMQNSPLFCIVNGCQGERDSSPFAASFFFVSQIWKLGRLSRTRERALKCAFYDGNFDTISNRDGRSYPLLFACFWFLSPPILPARGKIQTIWSPPATITFTNCAPN